MANPFDKMIEDLKNDDAPVVLSEENKDYMENAVTVKEFLDENDWDYSTSELQSDLVLYELSLGAHNIKLQIKIFVGANPNSCRINVILPITADATYEYPLCKLLAKENLTKRFGSFKYDERDGEITYEHSFLTRHGIFKDDFTSYFQAVLGSVVSSYDDIRKCCVGRFKDEELNEILKKVHDLVSDIGE